MKDIAEFADDLPLGWPCCIRHVGHLRVPQLSLKRGPG
jgi:hypothetical protein